MKCDAGAEWFDARQEPIGSGIDERNTRLISAKHAGLSAAKVGSLRLKWAFSMQDASQMIAQPLPAGGALFIGSQDGIVYALDARSGCVHWTFNGPAQRCELLQQGKLDFAVFAHPWLPYVWARSHCRPLAVRR